MSPVSEVKTLGAKSLEISAALRLGTSEVATGQRAWINGHKSVHIAMARAGAVH